MSKPFTLFFSPTPNGYQPLVLLEELKAVYPDIDYDLEKINLKSSQQKEPWFLELNPNGRIPVLVDKSQDNFAVFETSAILLYLADNYDKEFHFSFDREKNAKEYSEALQWIFFAHGGIGPMQGQAAHFIRYAPEDIPYGKKRYVDETKRLYSVLEQRLKTRDWLVGPGRGKYSIADMKAFPWVRTHAYVGVESMDEWPSVKSWLERAEARPAVQSASQVEK